MKNCNFTSGGFFYWRDVPLDELSPLFVYLFINQNQTQIRFEKYI